MPRLHKRMHSTMSKAERFVVPVDRNTLPRGYLVATTYAGIKKAISPAPTTASAPQQAPKPDLTLLVSSTPASVEVRSLPTSSKLRLWCMLPRLCKRRDLTPRLEPCL